MTNLVVGCGYLGLRVAREWVAAGREVVALTRSSEHAQQFKELGIQPLLGDVLDKESLRQLPDVETLLYAVGYDRTQSHSQREVYVNGLQNVLGELSGRCERVIYISSTSVYGQNMGEWINESSSCQPARTSGEICLQAEQVLENFIKQKHFPQAAILRCAGIYGPGRLLRRVEQLQAGATIPGRPDTWLNLIHVDDAMQAVLSTDDYLQAQTDVDLKHWLIADDRPVQRLVYYSVLANCLELTCPDFEEEPSHTKRAGLNKRCANARMKQELGVALKYPTLEEGLPHAVETTNS